MERPEVGVRGANLVRLLRRRRETLRSHIKMWSMASLSRWRGIRRQCPFSVVALETTTHCHRRCGYCPVSVAPKRARAMSTETFETIIAQLAALRFRGRMTYHHYNEPLLNRNLENIVGHAARRLPHARHVIYTSGDHLTDQRARSLFAAGVTSFVVTDHGGRPLPDYLKRPRTRWFDRRIRIRRFHSDSSLFNRGGLVTIDNPRRLTYCAYPTYEIVIDVDGNVILCCNDYHAEHRFGNVNAQPLMDIWNSSKMSRLRSRLLNGHFDLPICRACVGCEQPVPEVDSDLETPQLGSASHGTG